MNESVINPTNNKLTNSVSNKSSDGIKSEVPILIDLLLSDISYINEIIYNINSITNRLSNINAIVDDDNGCGSLETIDTDIVGNNSITNILENIINANRIIVIRTRLLNNHLIKLIG